MNFFKKIVSIFLICTAFLLPNNLATGENHESKIKTSDKIISLEGTKNTRDLGGYKIPNCDKITKHGVFFRSDNTHNLTENDIKKLKEQYNLKVVIDLRSEDEIDREIDKLKDIDWVTYYHIPIMFNEKISQNLLQMKITLAEANVVMFNEKETVKKLFDAIAEVDDGGILFHCANGKDRTGFLTMLLLGLMNVSKEDIIENYSSSWELIKDTEKIKNKIEKHGEPMRKIYLSLPEYIEPSIDYVHKNYGNFENYLTSCNISKKTLDKIKSRFAEVPFMKVIITGGAGFIGSYIVSELSKSNYEIFMIDNFSTGKMEDNES
ncbi:MAG: tyrosine-protein phosphatase [Oscillospiraceae bacterium]|jgi:protein-tyrosine phosphatase|nr:tyrosine-protein phosphatase [Oscillospiraceae bacterium]